MAQKLKPPKIFGGLKSTKLLWGARQKFGEVATTFPQIGPVRIPQINPDLRAQPIR